MLRDAFAGCMYEIKGLAIESIDIQADNVLIDIAQGVEIKLLSIQSVFKAFQVSRICYDMLL